MIRSLIALTVCALFASTAAAADKYVRLVNVETGKVLAVQDREDLATFLVRLCAGVGGLVATARLVCGILQAGIRFYCCQGADGGGGRGLASGGGNGGKIRTADLILPQERKATVVVSPAAAAAPLTVDGSGSEGLVTLQEVERLIKK